MDAAERELTEKTLSELFAAAEGGDATRALDDFGAAELFELDRAFALRAIFGLQGEWLAGSRTLHDLVARALAPALPDDWRTGAVLLPTSPAPGPAAGRLDGGSVHLDGFAPHRDEVGHLVAPVAGAEGRLALAAVDLAEVALQPVEGLDPWLGLSRVRGEARLAADPVDGAEAWPAAAALARVAIAQQMLGLVRRSLALASAHARDREQFGRPIGTYQAVKHMLADVKIALAGAEAVAADAAEAPAPLAGLLAKSLAGRAAGISNRNCLQVFGGIGWTWEHGFHRYQKRLIVLDRVLGAASRLPVEIGRLLVAGGEVPRLSQL